MADDPNAGLKGPTCIWCAKQHGLTGVRAPYESEIGTCANCGGYTYVAETSAWHRPKRVKEKAAA